MKTIIIFLASILISFTSSAQKDTTGKIKYKTFNSADKEYDLKILKRNDLIAAGKLSVYMKDFDFDLTFQIVSYHVTIILAGFLLEVKNMGAKFCQATIDLIKRAKRGRRVYFENIKVRAPDGTTRRLTPIIIKIM